MRFEMGDKPNACFARSATVRTNQSSVRWLWVSGDGHGSSNSLPAESGSLHLLDSLFLKVVDSLMDHFPSLVAVPGLILPVIWVDVTTFKAAFEQILESFLRASNQSRGGLNHTNPQVLTKSQ